MLQPDHLAPGLTISLSALEDISGGKPESVNKEVSEGESTARTPIAGTPTQGELNTGAPDVTKTKSVMQGDAVIVIRGLA
ncbi:hypothetical protein F2Q69_00022022 [Brassica cretica]|uniref:Uncharacterized protein n=1 Tax=Brassica cretica TaxID=69181 RepID=A0A8S9QNH8_BRACR|nr:hypothetical protein F2Q69_00022022 [Brassica cretica]